MEQKIQQQINPPYKIAIFAAYNFLGVSIMSFLAFRSFQTASVKMMNDRPAGQRLNIHNMTSFKGLSKAIMTVGVYLAGLGYLAWDLNLSDRVFQNCIKKDKEYTENIKLDPFFQDFYLINTMKYFGISERLIKKTEQQLKQNIQKNAGKQPKKPSIMINFQKSMIALAQLIGKQHKNV